MKERAVGSNLSWAVGKKTVLCVGNCVFDSISIVKKFPKENFTQNSIRTYVQRGGNASNVCTVLRKLGVKVEFFGMLSSLELFHILEDDMNKLAIIKNHCPCCNEPGPFSSVILTKEGQTRNVINCNASFPYVSIEDFRKLDLNEYGWIHFQARNPDTTMEMMQDIVAFNENQKEKIIISLDFDNNFHLMWPLVNYCDYVIFSKQIGIQKNWSSPEIACYNIEEQLRGRWGVNLKRPIVVFLWEKAGAAFIDLSSQYTFMPPYKPKKILDSLGAGDTFTAALIYAIYIRQRSLDIAVDFGNRLASHKCTQYGYDNIADIVLPPIF